MTKLTTSLAVALALAAPAVLAQERVLQFKSEEDPAHPPDPAVCAAAPFAANLRLGGSLHAYATRNKDGQMTGERQEPIGFATACAQVTNFAFPPGLSQNFYAQLTLPDGVYTASGTCTLISNDVPRGGLVLAGCNLKLVGYPAGVKGGAIVTLSTFNPFRLPGFGTGSFWTLQLYDDAAGTPGKQDSPRAMEWTDGHDDD